MGVCAVTGLAYLEEAVTGGTIAKSSYGPLNPLPRPIGPTDTTSWSRFDTPGSTVYMAADRRTAYAETLSMGKVSNDFRNAVACAAREFGRPVETARRMIQDDWRPNLLQRSTATLAWPSRRISVSKKLLLRRCRARTVRQRRSSPSGYGVGTMLLAKILCRSWKNRKSAEMTLT